MKIETAGARFALEKEAALPALIPAALTAYGLYSGASDLYEGASQGNLGQAAWGAAQLPLSLLGGGAGTLKLLGKAAPWVSKIPGVTKATRGLRQAAVALRPMDRAITQAGRKVLSPFARGAARIGATGLAKTIGGRRAGSMLGLGGLFTAGSMLFGGDGEEGHDAEVLAGHQQNPAIGIQPNLGNVQNVAPGIDLMRQTQAQNAGAKEPPMPFQQQQAPQMWGQQQDQE